MTIIRPLLHDASFNPEALNAMSLAYDRAKALIKECDQPSCDALAVRIVTLASCGELDPDKLAHHALNGFVTLERV